MHEAAMSYVRRVLERHTIPPGPVIEIGGRNINGTVRPLFDGIGPYGSVDLYAGDGVDVVADVCALDPVRLCRRLFQRAAVTCVVCCEVLEHSPQGQRICRWAYHVLGRRGVFIVTAANPLRAPHSALDGGGVRPGEYYRGVSARRLRAWLAAFARCEITLQGADIYAVAWKGAR